MRLQFPAEAGRGALRARPLALALVLVHVDRLVEEAQAEAQMTVETLTPKAPNCRDCLHYRETTIFELCMRANATYSIAGKIDQHTVGHMRRWECGDDGRLFEPRKVA